MKNQLLFLFFFGMLFFSAQASTEKSYSKEYYDNGQLKAEGWETADTKTDYWYFYHENGIIASKGSFRSNQKHGYWYHYDTNGNLVKEGHYKKGTAQDWWIFHDIATQTEQRFQYRNNQKHGFALIYKKRKLTRAEKYEHNEKVGEWTSIFSFKRDNPDVSF